MRGHRRVRALLALGATVFAVLALGALFVPPPLLEVELQQALLRLDTGPTGRLLRAIDNAGTWKVILPGTLVLFALSRQARARWWIWAVALLAAPAAEQLFKFAIGRPRPAAISMGFPSGHATAAAAFFGAVIYLAGRLPRGARYLVRALSLACIALVALARVALGAHWPTDALAGVALGFSLAMTAHLLASRADDAARRAPVTPAGEAPSPPPP